ncbi:MAG TPA: hypothetical protein DCM05_08415 [Elusimicrobia bacterium]|nr:hypothetical protein [Elusimicrobiota bacterium]
MDSSELQKQLDGLWERVTNGMPVQGPPAEASFPFAPQASSPAPLPSDPPSLTRDAQRETQELMRRRQEEQADELRRLVETKDASLRDLRARLDAGEKELALLRRRTQREDALVYQQVVETAARLEQAQGALQAQQSRFADEERALRGLLDQARGQLAAETGRWRSLERQWNEREQQYLLDMQELRSLAERCQQDSGRQEDRARKAENGLKEAKTAVEKTLAELLQERHDRQNAEKQLSDALGKVHEGEERLQQLRNVWEEERKQWQELWDRERSTWEGQRQELAGWEERLRKERETWHAGLQQMESKETHYAERMADILRTSSEAGEKVAGFMRTLSERKPPAEAPAPAVAVVRPSRPWPKILAGAAFALALAAAVPAHRYLTRLKIVPAASSPMAVESPTAMAYDGSLLWVCDWHGEFTSLDPQDPSRVVERVKAPARIGKYRPVALAMSGDALYSLDAAQGRVVRHAIGRPSDVKALWPSPGPAPAVLAHDGKNLWSYDAVTRTFYRHLTEGADAVAENFRAELEVVPTAMAWRDGELWVYDSKGKQMVVFGLRGHALEPRKAAAFPAPALSLTMVFAPSDKGRSALELWALSPAGADSPAPTLRRFRARR